MSTMEYLLWPFLLLALYSADIRCQSDVRRPPNIVDPNSPRTLYFSANSKVEIPCKAESQPQPIYKWTKNGEPVAVNEYVLYDSTSGNLTIPSFSRWEEGSYMCIASNVFDNEGGRVIATSFAPPVKLLQTRIEKFINAPQSSKEVTEYSYAVLECANKGEVVGADININWYESKESMDVSMDNGRLFIDYLGNLHFSYVLSKDATTNFRYLCGISSTSEKLIRLGNGTYLYVTNGIGNVAIKPQLRYKNSGIKCLRFNRCKLECMFSAYDPSGPTIIKWSNDAGNEIFEDTEKYILSEDRRALTITNLLEEDEKNYYCSAINTAGVSASETVFLDVTSAPIFNANGAPQDQTVPENVDVTFNCDARSAFNEMPPNTPNWYINGVKMGQHTDPTKFQLLNANKTLTIMKVKKATDILCVQCEVTNHVDTTWADACLTVLLPILVERRPIEEQHIDHGDSIDLTITASTDPSMTLSYRWEFNNVSYIGNNVPPFMVYDPTTMLVYINTSLLSEKDYETVGGNYRRVIFHPFQSVIVDTFVRLKDKPAVVPVDEADIDMWIVGLVVAIIFLLIVDIVIVFLICRKQHQGNYNATKLCDGTAENQIS